ncbi:Peptidoglycan endopeptidase RipA [Kibdelosporangium sp. 4NS15]|uniref:Peptidoglycan endopeptidase RipA n=2 Tax=Kibdelosporangium persicum TaxID=2698649 RepID=A0ABX2F052_9PSEU|nr:C40 family peptidase [Kibdelosporangium persicum]NRN64691.1 Peptidoglycan endopeptidase RipA [Kibdelosporangium persicum]
MSAAGFVGSLVEPMRQHLAKLDGDTGAGSRAGETFGRGATALTEMKDRQESQAKSALQGWYGEQANVFQGKSASFTNAMTTLAGNCTTAQQVASTAATAVTGGRTKIQGLIDEFVGWATPIMQAAEAAKQSGNEAAWGQAAADCKAKADDYATKTAQELQKVRDELTPLVGKLTGLPKVDAGAMGSLGGQMGPPSTGTSTASATVDGRSGIDSAQSGSHGGSGSGGGGGGGGGGAGGGGGGGGGGTAVGPNLPVAVPPQPGSGVGINLPGGASVEAPNEIAAAAVRNALTALGTPYVWGASNPPSGTDCSGLTSWAYAGAGMEIPRHSSAQAIGASVPDQSQLLPGDLVVWKGHVAMVIGDGQMIEAGDPVQINPIRTSNIGMPFMGFYRPTG